MWATDGFHGDRSLGSLRTRVAHVIAELGLLTGVHDRLADELLRGCGRGSAGARLAGESQRPRRPSPVCRARWSCRRQLSWLRSPIRSPPQPRSATADKAASGTLQRTQFLVHGVPDEPARDTFQRHVPIPGDECLQVPVCDTVRPSRPPGGGRAEGAVAVRETGEGDAAAGVAASADGAVSPVPTARPPVRLYSCQHLSRAKQVAEREVDRLRQWPLRASFSRVPIP